MAREGQWHHTCNTCVPTMQGATHGASVCPKHSMSITDAAVAQATFSRRQAEAHWREVVAGEGNLVGIIPSASSPDPREAQGAVAA